MDMRIRLPELMKGAGIETAYALSKASEGRISMSTAHRLVRSSGAVRYFDADLLEALCDLFRVGPGELLERDKKRGRAV
jgi:DNA-binding Xre family transcriptional regulator